MRLFALTTAALLLAAPLLRADDRKPPPDAEAQAKAEKLIKDLYKADFAKRKPSDVQELGAKLLKQADDAANDPAGKFVLLRLAQEVAAKAGDASTALQAVDAQAAEFAVDGAALKAQALDAAVRPMPGATPDYQAILDAALPLADEAQAADNYDAEARLLHAAQAAATKLSNKQVAGVLTERGKLVEATQKEYENIKPDFAALKGKPDDPDASLHCGRFLCFYKGDWDKGLPLLAQGSDAKWKELAKKELANPSAAADQAALADAWMDAADQEAGVRIPQIQMHAYAWYKQAEPQLSGLEKTKVDTKIKDLDKVAEKFAAPQTDEPPEPGWVVLFRSLDPRLWDPAIDVNIGRNGNAIPLSKAPDGVQYLRLALIGTGKYVIIPMTNERLKKKGDDGKIGWDGEDDQFHHGCHLGVYTLLTHEPLKGEICVANFGSGRDVTGWGFGHRAHRDDVQGFCWAGVPIGPSVFEIAVKAGPLSDKEATHLLGKK